MRQTHILRTGIFSVKIPRAARDIHIDFRKIKQKIKKTTIQQPTKKKKLHKIQMTR